MFGRKDKTTGYFWDTFRDICGMLANLLLAVALLAGIYGLNTFDFGPVIVTLVAALFLWFVSSLLSYLG